MKKICDKDKILKTELIFIYITHYHSKENSWNSSSNKAFPGFLGAELNQRSLAKEETKHVCHNIIDNNHGDRDNEPNHSMENVKDNKVTLRHNNEESHMCPGKEGKLSHVVFLLQRQYKPHKSNDVHGKWGEPMVGDQPAHDILWIARDMLRYMWQIFNLQHLKTKTIQNI